MLIDGPELAGLFKTPTIVTVDYRPRGPKVYDHMRAAFIELIAAGVFPEDVKADVSNDAMRQIQTMVQEAWLGSDFLKTVEVRFLRFYTGFEISLTFVEGNKETFATVILKIDPDKLFNDVVWRLIAINQAKPGVERIWCSRGTLFLSVSLSQEALKHSARFDFVKQA